MRYSFFTASFAAVCLASGVRAQGWSGDVATIGTTAQVITYKQGMASLNVQAGSVAAATPVFFGPSPLAPTLPTMIPGSVVAIGRPMLTLTKTAALTIGYEDGQLPNTLSEANLRIYVLKNHKWTLVGGTVNATANTVTVNITKAGTYCLLGTTTSALNSNNILVGLFDSGRNEQTERNGLPSHTFYSMGVALPEVFPPFEVGRGIERTNNVLVSPAYNAMFTGMVQPNGLFELYSVNADGSHPRRISNLGLQGIGQAAISQEGRTGVFAGYVGGTWNIYKMNTDGTAMAVLAAGVPGAIEPGPAVAINPAGTQAAFSVNGSVRVVTVATNAVVRTVALPGGATLVSGLAYNPAGTQIAAAANSGFFTMAPGAGAVTTRELSADSYYGPLCWSPDGLHIATQYQNQIDIYTIAGGTWTHPAFPDQNAPKYSIAWR